MAGSYEPRHAFFKEPNMNNQVCILLSGSISLIVGIAIGRWRGMSEALQRLKDGRAKRMKRPLRKAFMGNRYVKYRFRGDCYQAQSGVVFQPIAPPSQLHNLKGKVGWIEFTPDGVIGHGA